MKSNENLNLDLIESNHLHNIIYIFESAAKNLTDASPRQSDNTPSVVWTVHYQDKIPIGIKTSALHYDKISPADRYYFLDFSQDKSIHVTSENGQCIRIYPSEKWLEESDKLLLSKLQRTKITKILNCNTTFIYQLYLESQLATKFTPKLSERLSQQMTSNIGNKYNVSLLHQYFDHSYWSFEEEKSGYRGLLNTFNVYQATREIYYAIRLGHLPRKKNYAAVKEASVGVSMHIASSSKSNEESWEINYKNKPLFRLTVLCYEKITALSAENSTSSSWSLFSPKPSHEQIFWKKVLATFLNKTNRLSLFDAVFVLSEDLDNDSYDNFSVEGKNLIIYMMQAKAFINYYTLLKPHLEHLNIVSSSKIQGTTRLLGMVPEMQTAPQSLCLLNRK